MRIFRLGILVALASLAVSGCVKGGSNGLGCSVAAQTQTTVNSGVKLRASTPDYNSRIAQSFTANSDQTIKNVQLELTVTGQLATVSGTTSLTATIYSNDSTTNRPSTTAIATASIDAIQVTSTTGQFYVFDLSSTPITPAADNTIYWIVLSANYAASSANYVTWDGFNAASGGYSGGTTVYESSTNMNSWSDSLGSSQDMVFNVGC